MVLINSARRRERLTAKARERSEQIRMSATCKVERKAGQSTDRSTGKVTTLWTEIYDGPCRLTDFNAHPSTPEVAGQTLTVNQPVVLIPTSSSRVMPGDRVTIATDPDNPVNAGETFRVIAVRDKSQEKQRHLICNHFQDGAS